jgi:hypothetical protein
VITVLSDLGDSPERTEFKCMFVLIRTCVESVVVTEPRPSLFPLKASIEWVDEDTVRVYSGGFMLG